MNNTITYKASRKKAVLLLLGSACFVAIGVVTSPEKPLLGWATAVLFACGIPVSLVMLLRPDSMCLRLDEEGFEVVSFSRHDKTRWTEVAGFKIVSIRHTKMIGIMYSPECKKYSKAARAAARAVNGAEGMIPGGYDASLEDILNSLNSWKARFGSSDA